MTRYVDYEKTNHYLFYVDKKIKRVYDNNTLGEYMEKNIFIDDTPFISDDRFGVHSVIAETIKEIIIDKDLSNNSFTLGLFGSWGSGKSFIINKLLKTIEEYNKDSTEKLILINIDVWKFIDTPLLKSILLEIEKEVKEKYNKISENAFLFSGYSLNSYLNWNIDLFENNKKRNIFKDAITPGIAIIVNTLVLYLIYYFTQNPIFTNFAAPFAVLATVLFSQLKKDLSFDIIEQIKSTLKKDQKLTGKRDSINSPEQFDFLFDRIIRNICKEKDYEKSKFVFVFDNIDRCEPELAYKTLSTIKTYMDHKKCFYIIPCDDNAIKEYLSKKIENLPKIDYAKEYLDKLFQVTLRVPSLKTSDRSQYIDSLLEVIDLDEEIKQNKHNISEILFYAYKGKTPRQIIKFINDFLMYYKLAKNTDSERKFLIHDIPSFCIMMSIKQLWPKFEEYLINSPNHFSMVIKGELDIKKEEVDRIYSENFGVEEFIHKVILYLDTTLDVYPFIYLKHDSLINEIENILSGEKINLTQNNWDKIIAILQDTQPKILYKINTVISVLKSIPYTEESSIQSMYLLKMFNHEFSLFLREHFSDGSVTKEIFSSIVDFIKFKNYIKEKNHKKLYNRFISHNLNELSINNSDKLLSIINDQDSEEIVNVYFKTHNNNNTVEIIKFIAKQNKIEIIPEYIITNILKDINTNNIEQQYELLSLWKGKIYKTETLKLLLEKTTLLFNDLVSEYQPKVNSLVQNPQTRNELYARCKIFLKVNGLIHIGEQLDEVVKKYEEAFYNIFNLLRFLLNSSNMVDVCFESLRQYILLFSKSNNKIPDRNFHGMIDTILQNPDYIKGFIDTLNNEEIERLGESRYFSQFYKQPNFYKKFMSEKINKDNCNNIELWFTDGLTFELYTFLLEIMVNKKLFFTKDESKNRIIKMFFEFFKDSRFPNPEQVFNLLKQCCDLSESQKTILSYFNPIITYYLNNPDKGLYFFKEFKGLLTEKEYSEILINPVLRYFNLQIDSIQNINQFLNFSQILSNGVDKELVFRIVKSLLIIGKKTDEYKFGVDLLMFLKSEKYKRKQIDEFIAKINFDLYPPQIQEIMKPLES